jgi:predicted dehydrogenase
MTTPRLRVAIIGLGGFAASHHRALLSLEEKGICRVVATCDPAPQNFADAQTEWRFAARGVRVFDDYLKMLDALHEALDIVTVPTPVPLHAPMHQAIIERGLACYLEKPPTLDGRELDAMLEVEKRARFATQVGFNFIVETARQNLKKRILTGEFGALKRVSFLGHWPRGTEYFQRAPWAGRIRLNGRLVLDSCIGNAMAHYVHNLLFWAGTKELFDWARVEKIEAELYRAHAIENYDTVFAGGAFQNGVEFRIAASHACAQGQHHHEWIECQNASLLYFTNQRYEILWHEDPETPETGETDKGDLVARNFAAYFDYLRGAAPRPLTTLAESKPFVDLTNLVYIAAAGINQVPEKYIQRSGSTVAIEGIEKAMSDFVQRGKFPGEERHSPYEKRPAWGGKGYAAKASDLSKFAEIIGKIGLAN